MRHIQAHLTRLLLQFFFMLQLIIFKLSKFLFYLFKSLSLIFHLGSKKPNQQTKKKNQPVFSPVKNDFPNTCTAWF